MSELYKQIARALMEAILSADRVLVQASEITEALETLSRLVNDEGRAVSIKVISDAFAACGKELDIAMLFPSTAPKSEMTEVEHKRFQGMMIGQDPAEVWRSQAMTLAKELDNSIPVLEGAISYLAQRDTELFYLNPERVWEKRDHFLLKQKEAIEFYTTQFEILKRIIQADAWSVADWQDIRDYATLAAGKKIAKKVKQKKAESSV